MFVAEDLDGFVPSRQAHGPRAQELRSRTFASQPFLTACPLLLTAPWVSPGHPAAKLGAWLGQVSPPAEVAEGSAPPAWEKEAPCKLREGLPCSHSEPGLVAPGMELSYTQAWLLEEAGADGEGSSCLYLFVCGGSCIRASLSPEKGSP